MTLILIRLFFDCILGDSRGLWVFTRNSKWNNRSRLLLCNDLDLLGYFIFWEWRRDQENLYKGNRKTWIFWHLNMYYSIAKNDKANGFVVMQLADSKTIPIMFPPNFPKTRTLPRTIKLSRSPKEGEYIIFWHLNPAN